VNKIIEMILHRSAKTPGLTTPYPVAEPLRGMPGSVPKLSVPRVRPSNGLPQINVMLREDLRFRYPFPPPTTRLILKKAE
jgi:hypothetical protein